MQNEAGHCPECNSHRIYKDGLRLLANGKNSQRFLCRDCGYRFSNNFNKQCPTTDERQICVLLKDAKNLTNAIETKTIAGEESQNIKGNIVDFMWKLKRDGKSPTTIMTYANTLENLIKKGANLNDPENVKDIIAENETWTASRKYNAAKAYTVFLRLQGKKWEKPHYHVVAKLPFIPTEKEIDSLIASCNRRTSE